MQGDAEHGFPGEVKERNAICLKVRITWYIYNHVVASAVPGECMRRVDKVVPYRGDLGS